METVMMALKSPETDRRMSLPNLFTSSYFTIEGRLRRGAVLTFLREFFANILSRSVYFVCETMHVCDFAVFDRFAVDKLVVFRKFAKLEINCCFRTRKTFGNGEIFGSCNI
jgi:hypothetical protein